MIESALVSFFGPSITEGLLAVGGVTLATFGFALGIATAVWLFMLVTDL